MNNKNNKQVGLMKKTFVFIGLFSAFVLQTLAANPEVKIANGPLFSGRGNVHPNMVLSLSVEYPTVGIAYRGDNGTYNRSSEYVGYFNPLKCYAYNGGNRNLTDKGYFYIQKDADAATHECGGATFSGNFMNWASSSAIDMLRYALTGGDRIIDEIGKTILQRAFLKDSEDDNFYAHSTYFPRRELTQTANASAPKQVTPFDTKTLYIVSCRNRILFSDTSSKLLGSEGDGGKKASGYCTSTFNGVGKPATEATDKKLGEYLARVEVCDEIEGPNRTDLCKKYGSNYKPVGEIQRKADKLRLAAMGYLLDSSDTRYGGVLRAPMKYVGPKKIDPQNFTELANDKLEWNEQTGVFYTNPEDTENKSSLTSNSGVINYLNKFGRSGSYKGLDPVGELYYEGIRYLQGKQPTADATTGMTDAMKDGFPVVTTWADPVIASCQNNYMVSIADVNTHWDRYIPGNNRSTYGDKKANAYDSARTADTEQSGKTPKLDVMEWAKKVGDMESSNLYANPAPNAKLTNLESKDTGSGGHGTYYMAGLAYWANTNNIRLDKPTRVKTFAIDVDEGGNGLIDGNNRALKPRDSQLYLAAKYGGFDDRNNDGNPFVTVAADGKTKVLGTNAEWDDNGNGVPANYFLAGQPKELIQSIRKVFNNIANTSGTIGGVSVSSTKISSDGAFVYQPGFESSKWGGSLSKLALTLDDSGNIKIASVPVWDAGQLLSGSENTVATPLPDARNIYTVKTEVDSLITIPFKWDSLSDAQKGLLNISPVDGTDDGRGKSRLAFLRGERTLEQGQPNGIFRARGSVLGDIINSNPVYIGSPALNIFGDGYQKFYDDNQGRTPAIYVGANDGMLHAFSAVDGKELFAYAPNVLIQNLSQLTAPEYAHRPYVDGGINAAEALVNNKWKTVLAAGMGGGAQGVFALDVTNPSSFAAGSGALWEFTDADDPDMGNLTSLPVIAKFRTKITKGVPEYKYFVVVSSGLNNYKDDGKSNGKEKFNSDASSALFLLSLDKSASAKWEAGVNYYKFKTPSNDASLQNGLGAPALITGSNGSVRYAYAGDLQGSLWRFDFLAGDSLAKAQSQVGTKVPLFVAKDTKGNRQPISMQPKIVFAPGGGYVVLFGTGKFVEDSDATSGSFKPQSFYGIYDAIGTDDFKTVERSQLATRILEKNGSGFKITGDAFVYGTTDKYKRGWYFDFFESEQTGERAVTNPLLFTGMLFFNSLIPNSDPCAAGGGRSYVLDVLTGFTVKGIDTGFLSQYGMLSSPVVFQTAAEVTDKNAIGKRSVKKKLSVANFGTGGAGPAQNGLIESVVPAGRFSWRELINWQELRDALSKK